jgi:hypothetical protein
MQGYVYRELEKSSPVMVTAAASSTTMWRREKRARNIRNGVIVLSMPCPVGDRRGHGLGTVQYVRTWSPRRCVTGHGRRSPEVGSVTDETRRGGFGGFGGWCPPRVHSSRAIRPSARGSCAQSLDEALLGGTGDAGHQGSLSPFRCPPVPLSLPLPFRCPIRCPFGYDSDRNALILRAEERPRGPGLPVHVEGDNSASSGIPSSRLEGLHRVW